jgi:hypothetical protein
MYKDLFTAEMRNLSYSLKDICELIGAKYPTVYKRLDSPETFRVAELRALHAAGFSLDVTFNLIVNK